MSNRKAKKVTKGASNIRAAVVSNTIKAEKERAELVEWLEKNDPLYDHSDTTPITLTELFSTKLIHRTFTAVNVGEMPYNWEKFRGVLEARTSTSPRWFMQVREEDLLTDGVLEGVTVDCFVIAEATVPTLAPAYYVVKQHMPFSDLEDNAPERILPIEGQGMCWRRVVRDNGSSINAYLLQKRESGSTTIPAAQFGFGVTAPATTNPAANNSTAAAPNGGFGFGFGATAPATTNPAANNSTAAAPNGGFGFGFGVTAPATTNPAANNSTAAAPNGGFGFGFGATAPATTNPAANNSSVVNCSNSCFSNSVTPLKPSEVLFALWSKKRLAEMARSLKSGSRIVREGFKLGMGGDSIKLVMQNDLHDDVVATVRRLVVKMFAKRNTKIVKVDRWIDECPVYEDRLATALQKFRENYVREVAEKDSAFHALYEEHHEVMEAELTRIVETRKEMVQRELRCIDDIIRLLNEKKLADKGSFRLLKYYAANDVMRFRPFGKVSGISEMGECADVCDPPAPVLVNAFNSI